MNSFHGGAPAGLIDYSVNIPEHSKFLEGLDNFIKQSINTEYLAKYPEISRDRAKHLVSVLYNVKKERVLVGAGATELIYLVASVLCKNSLILTPTFTEYKRAVQSFGNNLTEIPIIDFNIEFFQKDFALLTDKIILNLAKLGEVDLSEYDSIFICNPSNPLGTILPTESIIDFCNKFSGYVIVDESFISFSQCDSLLKYELPENLIIIRSLTKEYGIAGIRLGFLHACETIINKLEHSIMPWNLSFISNLALEFIFANKDSINEELSNYYNNLKKVRANFSESLKKMGFQVTSSDVNFVLVRHEKGRAIFENLLARGIYLRRCVDFTGLDEEFLRIAIKKQEDMDFLIEEIKICLGY